MHAAKIDFRFPSPNLELIEPTIDPVDETFHWHYTRNRCMDVPLCGRFEGDFASTTQDTARVDCPDCRKLLGLEEEAP